MNQLQIEQSLTEWFSSNYAGEVDWGGLDQFDPEEDDLTSWTHFCVDMIREHPHRKNNKLVCDIRIVAQCWSRDAEDAFGEKNKYRARSKASEITELLRHAEIPIQDFTQDSEPTVGNCRLFEPKTTDETDRESDENSGYEMFMVVIDGYVEES